MRQSANQFEAGKKIAETEARRAPEQRAPEQEQEQRYFEEHSDEAARLSKTIGDFGLVST